MKRNFLFLTIIPFCLIASAQSFQWAKNMGGKGLELGNSITVDDKGNTYITGAYSGKSDFNPNSDTFNLISQGEYDIFIVKLNATGDFLWAKSIGGLYDDKAKSIVIDQFGCIYITGNFSEKVDFDPNSGIYDLIAEKLSNMFVLKLDTDGNFVWAKRINAYSSSIAIDAHGNTYTTGYFSGWVDFNPNLDTSYLNSIGDAIFISKLDSSGKFVWAKSLNSIGFDYTSGISIILDKHGNIYTTGCFNDSVDFDPNTGIYNIVAKSLMDIFILKLDSLGNLKWVKTIEGLKGKNNLNVSDINVDDSGNIYTTGNFKQYADFDPGLDTVNLTSKGGDDIFITKLDSSGIFVWAKSIGGEDYSFSKSIVLDDFGNVYTTGAFNKTVDFDPGIGTFDLTDSGPHYDIFISKLDSKGNFMAAYSMGGYGNSGATDIAIDHLENVYLTGYFEGRAYFIDNWNEIELISNGFSDIFVSKLTKNNLSTNKIATKNKFKISPNPCTNNLTIEINKDLLDSKFSIYNSLGQSVLIGNLEFETTIIDLNNFNTGVYLLTIGDNKRQTSKIIKH